MLASLSKLPSDLEEVKHILPLWFTYLYYFLWVVGAALVLCLIIYLISRLLLYLQTQQAGRFAQKTISERTFSKQELKLKLRHILDESMQSKMFRLGLHRMSGLLKTYFEILLRLEIEEMTALEIKQNVRDKKDMGQFFTELTVAQYQVKEPDELQFSVLYKKALELVGT